MRNMRKILIITGVIMVVGLGLAGCTKTEQETEEADASVVEAEDLPQAETPEGNPVNGEDPAAEDTNEKGGQNADSADNSQKDADFSSLRNIPDTDADLCGDIYEIGDKQFTVTEIFTDTVEGGGEVMVMGAPGTEAESPKITVVYDENTVFEKQKIWDGGASHEEREGSAADLQKGFTAEMWGSYEGDVFHATAIKVIEVIIK